MCSYFQDATKTDWVGWLKSFSYNETRPVETKDLKSIRVAVTRLSKRGVYYITEKLNKIEGAVQRVDRETWLKQRRRRCGRKEKRN